ncbi:hypothetical protein/N-acetylglucosaminyldiphosphoundecaprenol N-acetyl-beta-D-mannosaminyltransferase [Neorhodopirellula lusitana]|uniref:N-acetylglucosaminyldiphosphoundecaprenol N-acetyl-beta-D-mannosaminyltransferase n=1 Tax=Neorhodopirellula lusitana TaxID=445327 RepID=A0ABY1Q419_9BACT|nr:WecB/TagA/CpsF family glycosyltransferase [Neorhodopirellula lusitana]SMP58917.1 hypothetical protein/N-acetylglucosaminyldiphosphoundecaprenol N-acetyl-beta-D-mannosaminyltransferase [Neorhodopirellula lusitana]
MTNSTYSSTTPASSVVVVNPNKAAGTSAGQPANSAGPIDSGSRVGAPPVSATPVTYPGSSPGSPVAVQRERDTEVVWNVPFDRLDMSQSIDAIGELVAQDRPSYVVTANLNYCMLHDQDESVREITRAADLVLADGQPIVWRSQLDGNPLPERVAGSEMIIHLCERAAKEGWRVYFLGGAEGVAETCATRLQADFPGLQVAGTECPPFRQLTDQEHAEQLARIRYSETDLLFVAFGQPKGEKWIHENLSSLGNACCIQLGASFDFIAGTAVRAPEAYQKFGMEWAYRMARDPKRLVPRYAGNGWFLAKALLRDWQRQVKSWGMWD